MPRGAGAPCAVACGAGAVASASDRAKNRPSNLLNRVSPHSCAAAICNNSAGVCPGLAAEVARLATDERAEWLEKA